MLGVKNESGNWLQADATIAMRENDQHTGSEFASLLHRIWIGAKVAGHPAEEDYQQLFEDFTSGKREVADHAADEVQLLQSWGGA